MKQVVIFDLDNTIANDLWRVDRINLSEKDHFKRYSEYHKRAKYDLLGNHGLIEKHAYDCNLIFTARPEYCRTITENWLREYSIPFKKVLMRGMHQEGICSVELKKSMIIESCLQPSQVKVIYDDREDVVQMFLELGYNAKHVFINNPSLYTKTPK